jgi:uncharacterized protein HemX
MKTNKHLAIIAAIVLGMTGFSFSQNAPGDKSAEQTAARNDAKVTCGCGQASKDKKTADSTKLNNRKSGSAAEADEDTNQVSQACRDAVEREAEAAKESLVRWR